MFPTSSYHKLIKISSKYLAANKCTINRRSEQVFPKFITFSFFNRFLSFKAKSYSGFNYVGSIARVFKLNNTNRFARRKI